MLANIEVREALTMHFPGATLALVAFFFAFFLRCFGTDDLECEFSLIVNGCGGYKPRRDGARIFAKRGLIAFCVHGPGPPAWSECTCLYKSRLFTSQCVYQGA